MILFALFLRCRLRGLLMNALTFFFQGVHSLVYIHSLNLLFSLIRALGDGSNRWPRAPPGLPLSSWFGCLWREFCELRFSGSLLLCAENGVHSVFSTLALPLYEDRKLLVLCCVKKCVGRQGWHGKKNQPIKPGFFGWFFLGFFKRNLKKPGFYWVFSKFLVFL